MGHNGFKVAGSIDTMLLTVSQRFVNYLWCGSTGYLYQDHQLVPDVTWFILADGRYQLSTFLRISKQRIELILQFYDGLALFPSVVVVDDLFSSAGTYQVAAKFPV